MDGGEIGMRAPPLEQAKRSGRSCSAGSRKREQLEWLLRGNAQVSHCNKLCLHAARGSDV